jgi:hypothetical protein
VRERCSLSLFREADRASERASERERERERERDALARAHTHTHRERERERERETDTDTQTQTHRQTHTHIPTAAQVERMATVMAKRVVVKKEALQGCVA